jgi:hypothetical protein
MPETLIQRGETIKKGGKERDQDKQREDVEERHLQKIRCVRVAKVKIKSIQ